MLKNERAILLHIVDKVVPRVMERNAQEITNLKEIINQELQKEVGQVDIEKHKINPNKKTHY